MGSESLAVTDATSLVVAAWLLTYGLHSTLLYLGAWLIGGRALSVSNQLRDLLWKVALLGGIVTASLQMGLGHEPFGGHLALHKTRRAVAPEQGRLDPDAATLLASAVDGTRFDGNAETIPDSAIRHGAAAENHDDSTSRTTSDARVGLIANSAGDVAHATPPGTWARSRDAVAAIVPMGLLLRGLLVAWLAGVGVGLYRLRRARLQLHRQLGPRRLVTDTHLLHTLERLRRAAGRQRPVRLTWSAQACSPMALAGAEIVLPRRALDELDPTQQETMLAHEMAHVARRDPVWLLLSGVIESLFFFQPLHRMGRRHFQETTEYLCDEWAVEQTGHRVTLARCLAQIAGWLERPHGAPVACMARLGSPLVRRVQRLLEETPMHRSHLAFRGRAVVALLPLLLVGYLAPVVRAEAPAGDEQVSSATEYAARADEKDSRADEDHRSHSSWQDGDNSLEITARGTVNFDSDQSDVESISAGGYYRVEEEIDGKRRWLEVTPRRGGTLQHEYRVDGRTVQFDDDGRTWLADVLARQAVRHEKMKASRQKMQAYRAELSQQQQELRVQMQQLRDEERHLARQAREQAGALRVDEQTRQHADREAQREAAQEYRDQMRDVRERRSRAREHADRDTGSSYRVEARAARERERASRGEDLEARNRAIQLQRDARRVYREALEASRDDDLETRREKHKEAREAYERAMELAETARHTAADRQQVRQRRVLDKQRQARAAQMDSLREALQEQAEHERAATDQQRQAADAYREAVQLLQEQQQDRALDNHERQRESLEQLHEDLQKLRAQQMDLQREWQERQEQRRRQLRETLEEKGLGAGDVPLPPLAPMMSPPVVPVIAPFAPAPFALAPMPPRAAPALPGVLFLLSGAGVAPMAPAVDPFLLDESLVIPGPILDVPPGVDPSFLLPALAGAPLADPFMLLPVLPDVPYIDAIRAPLPPLAPLPPAPDVAPHAAPRVAPVPTPDTHPDGAPSASAAPGPRTRKAPPARRD